MLQFGPTCERLSTLVDKARTVKKPRCLNPTCSLHGNVESTGIIRYGFYRPTAGKRRRSRCIWCGQTFSTTKGERTAGARRVPPGEGNEARGDGRRGVGVSQSTAEAGKLSPRDPVEGRGHRQGAPLEGKTANTPRVGPVSTSRQRIAELARQALVHRFINTLTFSSCTERQNMAPYSRRSGAVNDASAEPLSDCAVGRRRTDVDRPGGTIHAPVFRGAPRHDDPAGGRGLVQ